MKTVNSRYPLAQMSQFLRLRKEFFTIDDATTYQLVTVQLHARGIRERQQLTGAEIKTKRQQRVQAGDLLVAEIDAKVGGFGVVPAELAGAIVSSHYFLYEIDISQIDPRYLEYYLKSDQPEQDVQQFVKGSVNYAAIRPHHFPQLHIPLPPLDEQRRIVARVEALAGRIAEAQGLQRSATNEAEALVSAYARKALSELDAEITELREWLSPEREGIQTGPFGAQLGADDFRDEGVPILTIGNVQYGGLEVKNLRHVSEEKAKRLARFIVQKGDILFARMGTVGRCCVIPPEAAGWLFNYHLIRVALDQNRVEPQFIHWTLRSSPDVEKYLGDTIRGATRQGVNSAIVGSLPCRVPSLPKQKRLVAYLDELHARSEGLTRLQESTQAELTALLPAVLDEAFRGEL